MKFLKKRLAIVVLICLSGIYTTQQVVAKGVTVQGEDLKEKTLSVFVKNIQLEQLGSAAPSYQIEKVEKDLFRVTAIQELKDDMKAKSWAVNLYPKFQGTFHWSSHLSPTDEHIVADHAFRAPAMLISSADKIITVIPDLDARAKSNYRWYMDMDAPRNCLTVGLSDYVVKEHVLFHKAESTAFKKGQLEVSFYVMVSDKQENITNPWRKPLAFMWEKYGKELSDKGEPLNGAVEPYVDHTYNWAFNTWEDAVWQEFELNGKKVGAPVFIVNYTQSPNYPGEVDEREFRSIWNQGWFNSLRSAQGLYRYGRRTNNADYIKRANMTKELALSFPQENGLFPGVIATEMEKVEINGKRYNRSKGWDTYYFGNSNRNPYTRDCRKSPLHILDMSCTAYFMLTWYEELEKDDRLLAYAKHYADGLLKYQDAEGFFPAWIYSDTKKPSDVLKQSPETSKSVTFLLKLSELTGEEKYKTAALKAMKAVIENIIPVGQWEDFETYWSCSHWGSKFLVDKKVERNNMFKQNTLAIYWTAEALLDCYEVTNDKRYLDLGQRTMDELLMAQAVWQPPFMYVKVFGGFGVMNADGEWNDSRQALFADLIIRYGKVLKIKEYVDRGVAAVKASFSMMYCPENPKTRKQWEIRYPFFKEQDYGFMMENYGHSGYTNPQGGGIGVFTIYDWGNGAASDAYNKIIDHYGIKLFKEK
ncbi:hypothetical protein EYV94_09890 [Puteibacter caeruleilacunae]|nr:hypothetical protein EYV94_09890 [Puteibacter caeruleilacunae]